MHSSISQEFLRFVQIVAALRHPETGCPWDLKQTHESLKPYLLEEAYEVLEAIESAHDKELCSELGDVLLQVVLHAQLATDRGAFSIEDVTRAVAEKMIRRHPHVFKDTKVADADEVVKNWEQIKSQERRSTSRTASQPHSAVDGIPRALPALIRAQRYGEKASKVKFDWEDCEQVMSKVREELAELQQEIQRAEVSRERVKEELGDLFFALTQLSRWLGVSAEDALHFATGKFDGRFRKLEQLAPKPLHDMTAAELDTLWEKCKTSGD